MAPNYRPVKPRVIAKKLELSPDETVELRRLVKKLAKKGTLVYGAKHLVGPAHAPPLKETAAERKKRKAAGAPAGTKAEGAGNDSEQGGKAAGKTEAGGKRKPGVIGVFRRHDQGYGFVRPIGSKAGDRSADIFITAQETGDAATGDTVRVKVGRERNRQGKASGRIEEIVERNTHRFVGTYFETGGAALVQVDGTLFSQPISVGDPGAKNAKPDDKVVFEMLRFPTYWQSGEGVIVEVLGARGTPGVDTLSIIREFNLPEAFEDDAIEDARRQAEAFDEEEIGERTDLREKTVVTIDPVDARDFDDAISLEKLENGNWLLGVHIADVAHFVRAKSPLDREARERGTSVYLPDRVIPMLPEVISNGLASLQPDRVRFVKTAFLEFTPEGVRTSTELANAAILSKRRFTYEEVDEFLADRGPWKEKLTPEVFRLLGDMHSLAMTLRGRRMNRGALELTMQEVKVDLDKDGRVSGAHRTVNTESHQIIEEFMLAANMAVAEEIAKAEWHFLRRIHQAPDPRKLKLLETFVESLGLKAEGLESRFELQRLLKEVHGKPEEQAVNYALLRSLQRARYSPEEEGHYALASDCYCHFTSPIRRYPDLTIHRLFDALLSGRKPRNDFDEMASLGEHCSDRERRAEAAERELTKVKLMHFLADRIGEELDAVVTGVEEFGLFAQGIEFPAEGMIHVSSLADDYYHFDRSTHTLEGRRGNRFRLGDPVRVSVARVDVERRELDFRLVERMKRSRGASGGSSKKQRPGRTPRHRGGKDDGDRGHGGGRNKRRRR